MATVVLDANSSPANATWPGSGTTPYIDATDASYVALFLVFGQTRMMVKATLPLSILLMMGPVLLMRMFLLTSRRLTKRKVAQTLLPPLIRGPR